MHTTPSVTHHPRSLTHRLLLAAALLLPAALHAQFPLPNAGVPFILIPGIDQQRWSAFRDRQDVVTLTRGNLALLANGNVITSDGRIVLTGCTAIDNTASARWDSTAARGLFCVIQQGKVVLYNNDVPAPAPFTLPPAVSALTDAVKVVFNGATFGALTISAVLRSNGKALVWRTGSPSDVKEITCSDIDTDDKNVFFTNPGPGGTMSFALFKIGLELSTETLPGGRLLNAARVQKKTLLDASTFPVVKGMLYLGFPEERSEQYDSVLQRWVARPLVPYRYSLSAGVISESTDCEVKTVATNAVGLCRTFIRSETDVAVAILKPAEVKVTDGTRPLNPTTPPAPPLAARKTAVRARLGLAAAVAENPLETSSGVFFGRVSVGVTTAAHLRTLTIRNSAAGTLTLGAVTVDGAAAGDFAVTPPATTVLGRGEATSFAVQFTPSATGRRTAALHIASDDPDHPSFDIELNGFGQDTNASPLAVLDTLTAPAGGDVTFTKLLTNDSDPDGDPVKVTEVAAIDGVTQGSVTLQDDGTVAYISPDEVGTDHFQYTVTDGTVTQTGTVDVNVVDPVPLADGLTYRGSEGADSAVLTLSRLPASYTSAKTAKAAKTAAAAKVAATPVLTATFSENIHGHSYRGSVRFPANTNSGEAQLSGSEDINRTQFEITCDEDGNPRVIVRATSGLSDPIELTPDTFDSRHRAPAGLVGTYTMKMPGTSFDGERPADVDSIASATVTTDGRVLMRGVMADGQVFSGAGYLVDDLRAEFDIPLYARGRGRLVGELTFDATNPEGSVSGSVTWVKEDGVPGLPYDQAFATTGAVVGGVYDAGELPGNTVNFTFGTDEEPQGTGTGKLASKFSITGTNTTGSFVLGSVFARTTGLIIGNRPARATNGPRTLAAVVLLEQGEVAGSSAVTIPPRTISTGITLPAYNTTVPLTGAFPP